LKKQAAKEVKSATQRGRFFRACLMVVFVVAAFWAALTLPSLTKNLSMADAAEEADFAGIKGVWSTLSSSGDIAQAMRDCGYMDLSDTGAQPEWIQRELFEVESVPDSICFAANDYSSIAILREGIEDANAALMQELLELAGWALHPTGIDGAYSALKDTGDINWLYVQAVVNNGSTLYTIVINS
jgi:hypothetical protein